MKLTEIEPYFLKIWMWVKANALKAWDGIKALPLKIWTWIKETDWLYVFDSKEFTYMFPLGVFVTVLAFTLYNPLSWIVVILWIIHIFRTYNV